MRFPALSQAVMVGMLLLACQTAAQGPREPGARAAQKREVVEPIFSSEKGIQRGWKDFGWAPRTVTPGAPAQLDMSNRAGWILARPSLQGRFGGVSFRFRAPKEFGDFLEVRVDSSRGDVFPRFKPLAADRIDLSDGWEEVWIPLSVLNPRDVWFDRVVIRAHLPVGKQKVELDQVGLTEEVVGGPGSGTPELDPASIRVSARDVRVLVDCRGPGKAINPLIYGIAYKPWTDARDTQQWDLGATGRRWGGNPTSRYNWELGNAWNTANDWFFRNVNYTGVENYTYRMFLEDNLTRGVQTALTVPIMGWVAKDTRSYSFPASLYGPQQQFAPEMGDAGNGVSREGKKMPSPSPDRTSVAASPEFIGRWVSTIREQDQKRSKRSVQMYILDNEPMLWHDTHRDVHPDPVSYDELLDRTIQYGTAVRKADPEAVIAGPAEWGWPAFFYSAVDANVGFGLKPDRLAHGNTPLLPWYLRRLKEHQAKTGVKVLDVLDVHFYPQAAGLKVGVHGETDSTTNALRLRSTRALWDPSYVDEGWIKEPVRLIPRLKEWVDENYPGLGISIGEWNFGAENHMSGGLAVAEALGRFGQQGLTSAFYWDYPPQDSPAFWAFRAFRNFDGKGARFEDTAVETMVNGALISAFVSRSADGKRAVAMLLNFDPSGFARAKVDFAGCGPVTGQRVYSYGGGVAGFAPVSAPGPGSPESLDHLLSPYSITLLDLTLSPRAAPRPGN